MVGVIKAALVFKVAALDLIVAVMGVSANDFVLNRKAFRDDLGKAFQISVCVAKRCFTMQRYQMGT